MRSTVTMDTDEYQKLIQEKDMLKQRVEELAQSLESKDVILIDKYHKGYWPEIVKGRDKILEHISSLENAWVKIAKEKEQENKKKWWQF